ncbi:MAG: mechanosensitive ion channel family protein [archaeon]|nr:mechanosensitive ion channel family protein [archaeon]
MPIEIFQLFEGEYSEFITIMAIGLFIGIIIYLIFKYYFSTTLSGARTKVKKMVGDFIPKPVFILVFLATLSFALKSVASLQAYHEYINNTFFTLAVMISAYILAEISGEILISWIKSKKGYSKPPKIITKILAATIYLIAVLVILINYKIEITPLVATLGVGGIAIGLALQGTLSNFFAGLNVLSDRPIRVGDFVELESTGTTELKGYVEDIGWRSTRLKTLVDTIIIVPNAKLAESIIINYSMPDSNVSIYLECGVAYEADLEQVEKVTLETVEYCKKTVKGMIPEVEPSFRLREFGDSNINFRIYFTINEYPDQFKIKTEFIKELKKRFDAAGIEISWPIMKIYYPQKEVLGHYNKK